MSISAPEPLVVVWRVTEACDLGCWFCEFNRHLRHPRHSARADVVLAFGALLARYGATTGRPVLVSWLGGEPLLWPPLVEVGQTFRREYGLRLGVTSNGTHFDSPQLLRHLAEAYDQVTVSVDGPGEFHDLGRGAPGLYNRLCAAVGALRELRERQGYGPLLRANTILMRSNISSFEALCCSLADWGIEEVTFNALGGAPAGPFYVRERLQPEQVAWLRLALPGIRERLAARGLTLRGSDHYLGRLHVAASGGVMPVADCRPGGDFLFVDEQGRVAPCSFTAAAHGQPLADVRSLPDLAQLSHLLAERRSREQWTPCRDCYNPQVFGKFDLAQIP
jgi:MoaA/NifB/PqqE/SkfB family radical SAM enzyme